MVFEREAFWSRFKARWYEAFRRSKVRWLRASLTLSRAMKVDRAPQQGRPRRMSSGLRKRGWAFAHLRGWVQTGLADFGGIVRLGNIDLAGNGRIFEDDGGGWFYRCRLH